MARSLITDDELARAYEVLSTTVYAAGAKEKVVRAERRRVRAMKVRHLVRLAKKIQARGRWLAGAQ